MMNAALYRVVAWFLLFGSAQVLASIVEENFPLVDTGIPSSREFGSQLAWLDSNTLAVTTAIEGRPVYVRKVVGFSLKSKELRTLAPLGFLGCTSHAAGIFSMSTGDFRKMMEGGSTASDPVQKFYRWSGMFNRLMETDPNPKTWHPELCRHVESTDVKRLALETTREPVRYLEAQDGSIRWTRPYPDSPVPLMLHRPGSKAMPLDALSDEIGLAPQYLPFARSYVLHPGQFTFSGHFVYRNKNTNQIPAVLMSYDGKISRLQIPQSLVDYAGKVGAGGAATVNQSSAGVLVLLASKWSEHGAGIYLASNGSTKRVWCNPSVEEPKPVCEIRQALLVSPDGCKVAFDAEFPRNRQFGASIRIMSLCKK